MIVPNLLIDSIRSGNAVLVLGAGASVGAVNPTGMPVPMGPDLSRLLAEKFLGGEHANDPLARVAELSISESDLFTVQEYIRALFQDLQPADFHRLLPTFKWAAIATTNYDLVIERAYSQHKESSQKPVPFIKDGNRVDEKLKSPLSFMLLKLHGCITDTADDKVPLILSVDQYLTHRQGRNRVFGHLESLSYEHPLVFIGHSLQDPDIRHLLLEFGNSELRPRYYAVAPNLTGPERRLWDSRRITAIDGTFKEFLRALDEQMSSPFRGVVPVPAETELPIANRFVVSNAGLSDECVNFLTDDVDYIHEHMPVEDISPKLFYRGFNPRWTAVERHLDARRDLEDAVLLRAVLDDELQQKCRFYAIKGHAGSGKSVFMQRIAWESANTHHKLCLYVRPNRELSFNAIRELSKVVDERIFVFIDDVNEHVYEVATLISQAKKQSVALTIIGAARVNEWNVTCEELEPGVEEEFELRYLSTREIDRLLSLLERHGALYRLQDVSEAERRLAFRERAGRQLLVALHEATLGKPFEDIVADEFREIRPDAAREMYLGMCFLNRYDVPVRAGIISRTYNVNFTMYSERFFRPLEGLVFARYDSKLRDYTYVTRHSHIAEIVVSRALPRAADKVDMYLAMLDTLNIDYDSDRKAFRNLVRGRSILEELPDHNMAQRVYLAARLKFRQDPYLLHQLGLYEMHRPNGSLREAMEHLTRASQLSPSDRSIKHSLAELQLRMADGAANDLEFQSHIDWALRLLEPLATSTAMVSHSFHTLAKVHIAQIRRLMNSSDSSLDDVSLGNLVKNAESALQKGLQQFSDDPYLLSAESELGKLLSDDERTRFALELGFQKNRHNGFIASRLAKLLVSNNEVEKAVNVYKQALDAGAQDKQIHFNYGKLLMEQANSNGMDIEYHLRQAFSQGDANIEAQFWYARQLFVNGKVTDAQNQFRQLESSAVNPQIKRAIRGLLCEQGELKRFTGKIGRLHADYGFVVRDGMGDWIFLHVTQVDDMTWRLLHTDTRVSFGIGFNFRGPAVSQISVETAT